MSDNAEKKVTRCPCCEQYRRTVENRRLNTAYVDDTRNYLISCKKCYDQAYSDYAQMWEDYYSSCL